MASRCTLWPMPCRITPDRWMSVTVRMNQLTVHNVPNETSARTGNNGRFFLLPMSSRRKKKISAMEMR